MARAERDFLRPSHLPRLGIAPDRAGGLRILVLERIQPLSVEMVYNQIYWWQRLSRHSISFINIWPLPVFGGLPHDLDLDYFDAVFLCPRLAYDPATLHFLDANLSTKWRSYPGVKILSRQDEHYRTQAIESFIVNNEFDVFLSCVPAPEFHKAYPKLSQTETDVIHTLTGYVTPDLREATPRAYAEKDIDVSYRAYEGPLSCGRLVYEKHKIGADFLKRAEGLQLALDISLRKEDRLYGSAWAELLDRSRAVLGTESGANIFDFDGSVQRWCEDFYRRIQNLSPEECYALAQEEKLGALEGNVNYGQIAPRHFEAAAARCLQIMYSGDYSGILVADRHFFELSRDGSNLSDAVEAVRSPDFHKEMTGRAFEEVIQDRSNWIEAFLGKLDDAVDAARQRKGAAAAARPASRRRHSGAPSEPVLVELRTVKTASASAAVKSLEQSLARAGIRHVLADVGGWGDGRFRRLARRGAVEEPELTMPGWGGEILVAAGADHETLWERLGAYDLPPGAIDKFRLLCRRSLNLAAAVVRMETAFEAANGLLVSDPGSMLAATALRARRQLPLYLNFDSFGAALQGSVGWEWAFWQSLTHAFLADDVTVVASTPDAANLARASGLDQRLCILDTDFLSAAWSAVLADCSGKAGYLRTGDALNRLLTSPLMGVLNESSTEEQSPVLASGFMEFIEIELGPRSFRYYARIRQAAAAAEEAGFPEDAGEILRRAVAAYVRVLEEKPNAEDGAAVKKWMVRVIELHNRLTAAGRLQEHRYKESKNAYNRRLERMRKQFRGRSLEVISEGAGPEAPPGANGSAHGMTRATKAVRTSLRSVMSRSYFSARTWKVPAWFGRDERARETRRAR